MSFNVSGITDYVKANEEKLIGKAIIGAKTASYLTLQTGVKGSAYLNLLTADPTLQAGACGWSAAGSTSVSRREIKTGQIKVNQPFCDKDLINTFMQHGVRIAAGQKELPFEEEFVEQNLKGIQKKLEEIVWNGDVTGSTSTHLDLFDGFIKIFANEASVVDATVSGKTLATNTLDALDAMVAGLPNEVIDRDDLVIFVGVEIYRKAIKAYQDANLYHYVPAALEGTLETVIPGTNIKLVGVHGLTGKNKAYGSYVANMFLGSDLEGDSEKFTFWYSEDNSEFRLKVEFNAGVNVAFPDHVVAYLA